MGKKVSGLAELKVLTITSFADAEAGEDGLEEGVGADVAGEGGEVVDGLADVLGEEVA